MAHPKMRCQKSKEALTPLENELLMFVIDMAEMFSDTNMNLDAVYNVNDNHKKTGYPANSEKKITDEICDFPGFQSCIDEPFRSKIPAIQRLKGKVLRKQSVVVRKKKKKVNVNVNREKTINRLVNLERKHLVEVNNHRKKRRTAVGKNTFKKSQQELKIAMELIRRCFPHLNGKRHLRALNLLDVVNMTTYAVQELKRQDEEFASLQKQQVMMLKTLIALLKGGKTGIEENEKTTKIVEGSEKVLWKDEQSDILNNFTGFESPYPHKFSERCDSNTSSLFCEHDPLAESLYDFIGFDTHDQALAPFDHLPPAFTPSDIFSLKFVFYPLNISYVTSLKQWKPVETLPSPDHDSILMGSTHIDNNIVYPEDGSFLIPKKKVPNGLRYSSGSHTETPEGVGRTKYNRIIQLPRKYTVPDSAHSSVLSVKGPNENSKSNNRKAPPPKYSEPIGRSPTESKVVLHRLSNALWNREPTKSQDFQNTDKKCVRKKLGTLKELSKTYSTSLKSSEKEHIKSSVNRSKLIRSWKIVKSLKNFKFSLKRDEADSCRKSVIPRRSRKSKGSRKRHSSIIRSSDSSKVKLVLKSKKPPNQALASSNNSFGSGICISRPSKLTEDFRTLGSNPRPSSPWKFEGFEYSGNLVNKMRKSTKTSSKYHDDNIYNCLPRETKPSDESFSVHCSNDSITVNFNSHSSISKSMNLNELSSSTPIVDELSCSTHQPIEMSAAEEKHITFKELKCSLCDFSTSKLGVLKRHQLCHKKSYSSPDREMASDSVSPFREWCDKTLSPVKSPNTLVPSSIAPSSSSEYFPSSHSDIFEDDWMDSVSNKVFMKEKTQLKTWSRREKFELLWCYYYSCCDVFPVEGSFGRMKAALQERGRLSQEKWEGFDLFSLALAILSNKKVRAREITPLKINAEITARKEILSCT